MKAADETPVISVDRQTSERRSATGPVPKGLIVDLTDVSYIDSVGEQVLAWLAGVGASFMARGVYGVSVCERLRHRSTGDCAGGVGRTSASYFCFCSGVRTSDTRDISSFFSDCNRVNRCCMVRVVSLKTSSDFLVSSWRIVVTFFA